MSGLLKEMLPNAALATANASIQTVREGLRLAGPLIGSLLFATAGRAVGCSAALVSPPSS